MKKRTLGISLVLSAFALTLGAFLIPSKEAKKAEGYSASTLPTTIDLKDCTDSEIRSYYSGVSGQGNNLLISLKNRLKNGQKYYSYDSGSAIWQIYEIADRDWEKSPASSTTYGTYNSSTQKITNYQYGTSATNSRNNPYIHALYITRSVENLTTAWDDHQQTQWGINREHVWPKAEGFEESGEGGARGDPFHLMAGNGKVNNTHSNYYYGYVNKTDSYTDCGKTFSNHKGNYLGKSLTLGGTTKVFEPQDSDKGDIARAIFYMVARYNYLSGSDSDGIDSNNPNLALTQSLSDWASSGYVCSKTNPGKMGVMTDLLNWHHSDPVDEFEIHRNNLLYKNYTNNRNPFIDFPEWVDYIWGTATYNGTTYQSYNSTPTGSANPSSDTINGYNSGSTVSVTGVSLNKSSTSLYVGDTESLVATVSPSNATNKNVTWSSSNTSKVTVNSNGLITAVAKGNATITVRTADGSFTDTCTVTVNTPTKTLSSIELSEDYKTSFEIDDEFSFGGTVTAHYSDSSSENVTSLASFDGFDSSTAGSQTITVSFTYGGVTKTAEYVVTINSGASSGDGEHYSGTLTEGDYVIYYNQKAIKNSISSANRFEYTEVTPSGSIISQPDASLIWHIAPSGSYWTIFNVVAGKYAAGNGTNNKGALISEENDYSLWTVSGTSTYEFVNKGNTSVGANANLRNNGTYGFACYSQSTGGALSLYKVSNPPIVDPTSISATCSKSYYVGETITKDDVIVKDNFNRLITDFSFPNYTFIFDDTDGGNTVSEHDFDVSYGELETVLTVDIQRKAYDPNSVISETLTRDVIGLTDSDKTYRDWSNISTGDTNAIYAGNSAGYYENKDVHSIQIRTNNSNSGIISTKSGGLLKSVSIVFDSYNFEGKTVDIYGKNTTYSAPTDLYDSSLQGTKLGSIIKGTNDSIDISGEYRYIGIRSNDGSAYLTSITISYAGETAENLSNYIMYEDTENQCSTGGKFGTAKGYFESLTKNRRATFMTSDDYVISTARERFIAWATHEGKSINLINGDYVVSGAKTPSIFGQTFETPTLVIIVIASVGIAALGGYLFIRRYKQK